MPASAAWLRLLCLGEICEMVARKNTAFDNILQQASPSHLPLMKLRSKCS
jgi:hypothetical protein